MLLEESGEAHHGLGPASTVQPRPHVLEYEEVCPQIQYNYPDDDDFFSDLQEEPLHMEELVEGETTHADPPIQIQVLSPIVEQVSNHASLVQPKAMSGPELLESEDVENYADDILNYPENVLKYYSEPKDDPVVHSA